VLARNQEQGRREKVTLTELANHAGVSRSTVSLVLRDSPLVKDETRRRVRQSIATLGYVYDRSAAGMRAKLSRTVGLVVVDLTNSFYAELIAGIDTVLDRAGQVAFLSNTGENPERQRRVLDRLREHSVDGVILCPAEGASPGLIEAVLSSGIPCIQVLRSIEGTSADYAGTDNRLGADLATDHLVGLGHRCIAFLGGAADTSVSRDRKAGYLDALSRHGITPLVEPCRSTKGEAAAAVARVLAGESPPTAIVCFNDPVAMGAMFGIAEAGLRPGEDVAVIGFDDTADAAFCRPSLSSVSIQPTALGEAAADLLLRRIAEPNGAPERLVIPPRLVVRASSGPTRGASESRS
jgi:LacI family transcriptional regulator